MKARQIAGKVANWMLTIITALVVVTMLTLAVAQRRSADGMPHVGNYSILSVLSGSMTPVFRTGSAIIDRVVTPAQAQHLKVGQIITFKTGKVFDGAPMMITHRIVGIVSIKSSQSKTANHLYVTKGDANNTIDSATVSPSEVVGVYQTNIPYLGYVSGFMHQPKGFLLLIVLPFLYLIGSVFFRLWRRIDEEERQAEEPPMLAQGGDGSH